MAVESKSMCEVRSTQLVSEATPRQADVRKVKEQIAAFRQSMPALSVSDILSARHESHMYRCPSSSTHP
jgi:hypothetical protein